MTEKEMQRQIRAEMNRCIHFNGIQHEECKVGINYRKLIGGPDFGWAAHMPCLKDDESSVACASATFPSEKQARADVEKHNAAVAEFIQQLNNGICPHCKVPVKQKQVGHCVYGTCGHRLYQGTVNPDHAAKTDR